MPPTSDAQIRFMVKIQRLLDEDLFTASYKFALTSSPPEARGPSCPEVQ